MTLTPGKRARVRRPFAYPERGARLPAPYPREILTPQRTRQGVERRVT